ncbi:hypothetical protein [Streptomyces sp. NPDC001068]|uniref:hypothetical protein n=1 Tax=Streptomyces sp. NPDC001068 TaxID=3364544 RepID=UPI00368505F1
MPNDLTAAVLEQPTFPYCYTDGQNHRLILRTATDASKRPYVWVEGENLALGGDVVSMWLTIEQADELDAALHARREYHATDHTGDSLTVLPGGTWTTFEVTRQANDDDEGATVRVVVLTGRLPELRDALTAAAQYAQQRAAGNVQPPRVLTPGEHDRAWHAIEGAAGEPGADPGTILSAVLAALNIQPPSAEDEAAASAAMRARRDVRNGTPRRGR